MAEKKEYSGVKSNDVDIEMIEKGEKKENNDMTEHTLTFEELERIHGGTSFESGLSSAEAKKRLERDGLNMLTPPERQHWFWKAFAHIAGGFAILLWIGSALCFIVYGIDGNVSDLTLAVVLAVVVLSTGIFSWYQEMKADSVLAGFLKLSPSTADTLRDGSYVEINAQDLVIGDVVRLQFGKKVPADVVILESAGCKVDNSSLTGESEPKKVTVGASDPSSWRSKNVAFFGTNCVEGTGKGVVMRCGDNTAIGMIASSVAEADKPETLMKLEIERFVNIIGAIAITIGIVFLICALAMGYTTQDALIFTIGIIVANVPEGLLATVTVALTITAQRMAEKNVLVKSTLIVETLGSITVVASDKTGTLTQNRMTVRNAIYSDSTINVTRHPNKRSTSNVFAESDDKKEPAAPGTATGDAKFIPYYNDLVKSAGLCNHASFDERKSEILVRRTNGDASENALLKFSHSNGNTDILKKTYPEVACIPFNSTNKFMVTIHTIPDSDDYLCLIKGAPERILEKCSTYTDTTDNKVKPFDADINAKVVRSNTQLATNGERVLAFGQKTLSNLGKNFHFETEDLKALNFSIEEFRFTGMLSLEDPPREEVPDAIVKCHEAGIRVIMVTGDHPLTARSIAAQIGILTEADGGKDAYIFDNKLSPSERRPQNRSGVVVTGDLLATLDEDDWEYILTRNGTVFARTLPTQKQDIVKRLQDRNEIVAVTGDGVNDSPALKQAQVGIAMGTGSEVAKEAADLILMDDNFASIVKGIEEGRKIFANLKKSIAYTLTSNIPEIIPFLAQIALKLPLGLTTIMILCVDLGTDILPAISFAYETSESDIMKQKPRNVNVDKLVTWQLISWAYLQIGIIQAMAAFTTLFFVLNKLGYTTSFILDSKPGFDWSNKACDPLGTGDSTLDNTDGKECEVTCFEKYSDGWEAGTLVCASYDEREEDLKLAQTAFLASIVICQIGCGVSAKTRITSIFDQGFGNKVFNVGVLQESVLIVLLVYAPFLHSAFGTRNTSIDEWLIAVPFALCIWLYDETRKYLMRRHPDSEFKKNLFF